MATESESLMAEPKDTAPVDLTAVGLQIVEEAQSAGLDVRLIGGVAIALRCRPDEPIVGSSRRYGDIDLCGLSKSSRDYGQLLEGMGYEPSLPFNQLNAAVYQRFDHSERPVHLDLFFDSLRMCHELPFRERLTLGRHTLTPADLLLSKLQIVELNEKDIHDVHTLLAQYELGNSDDDSCICVDRIAQVCARDWGWWRTARGTLEKCAGPGHQWSGDQTRRATVAGSLASLREAIEDVPKTVKWRARARIGERVRWYELPEDPTRA